MDSSTNSVAKEMEPQGLWWGQAKPVPAMFCPSANPKVGLIERNYLAKQPAEAAQHPRVEVG